MRYRRLILAVVVAAVAGILLGLAPRLLAGRRARVASARQAAARREADRKNDQFAEIRHAIDGTRITSPAPGILRVDGTYRVNPGSRRKESTAIHLKVISGSGAVVWDDEMERYAHGPQEGGTYPIRIELPGLPAGTYDAYLYVWDTQVHYTDATGREGKFVVCSMQHPVEVK